MNIKIGVSARHIHLTKEDLELLFGTGYELTKIKDLVQGGEYASNETLTIKGDKGEIKNVRILGPIREYTQVEISKTDAYTLGLNPPIRRSGDILGSSPITLIGPKREIHKDYGCIISERHIHFSPEEAERYSLTDRQIVQVRIGGIKGGILDNVYIEVKDTYHMELQLDVDDANAHLVKTGDEGELIINE